MRLADIHAESVEVAKDAKRRAVCRDGARRGSDMSPQLLCFRGREPVAIVILRRHVRDEILMAFRVCASGFAADSISTIFETYAALGTPGEPALNPRTGQPWTEGGMQYEAEHHQGVERGRVTEALVVTTANRAGDVAFTTLPYHYDPAEGLVWEEAHDLGEPGGHMIRAMVKAMNSPAGEVLARELAARTTIDERDTWTAGLLMGNAECMVALIAPSTDPDRIATLSARGELLPPPERIDP
jgi:hypothetical protein